MTYANSLKGMMAAWALAFCTSGVCAQDWPQWRGANRDAKAVGFEAPKTWPKELTQKWKVAVGNGDATPSLAGDKLYVFTRQGEDEVIRCLDAATGKEIWLDKYAAQPAIQPAGGPHAGPRCSPTVADDKVVTLGARGTLSCYEAASGKKLWQKDEFRAWPRFFVSSSPIIVGGLCIAQLGGGKNGALVAYDLATGDEKWKWTSGSPGYASPVLMTVGDAKLVVALTEGKVVAVNVADGKPVWEKPFAVQGMGYNASTPIVDGQTIIYGGSGRGETAVKFEKKDDTFAATELWKNKENSVIFNTPVLKDGMLYGLTQTSQFFCVNAQDGKTAWTGPAPAGAAGGAGGGRRGGGGRTVGYGSIVDCGTVLLALTPSSQLIVLASSDKEYKQLASYKVADTPTFTYPVPSGKRIYTKDQEFVTLWTVE